MDRLFTHKEKPTASSPTALASPVERTTAKVSQMFPHQDGASNTPSHSILSLARSTLDQPATKVAIHDRAGQKGFFQDHPRSRINSPTSNFTAQPTLQRQDAFMYLLNEEEILDMSKPIAPVRQLVPPVDQDAESADESSSDSDNPKEQSRSKAPKRKVRSNNPGNGVPLGNVRSTNPGNGVPL